VNAEASVVHEANERRAQTIVRMQIVVEFWRDFPNLKAKVFWYKSQTLLRIRRQSKPQAEI